MFVRHTMGHSKASLTAVGSEMKAPRLDFISIINILFLVGLSFSLCIGKKKKGHVNKEGTGQRLDKNPAN